MRRHLARRLGALAIALSTVAGSRIAHAVPAADHVFIVIMENRSLSQARAQPYTASLMAANTWLAQSFGVTHPSQPNYIVLWSGATQGVTTDACPAVGSPFGAANLGQALEAAGKTWRAYSENLGAVGATDCSFDGDAVTGLYTRKHDPWTYFTNVDHSNERPYSDFAVDMAANQFPNLSYIIPNNCHNSHDLSTDPSCTVAAADAWLAANVQPIIDQMGPRDVLFLTWDEDDGHAGNNILTVIAGPMVQHGYVSVNFVTHYTVVRTIADLLGVPAPGQAATTFPINDVWDALTGARRSSWGTLKLLYR